MTLLECLMSLTPEQRAETEAVGIVAANGQALTITFGKCIPAERVKPLFPATP